MLQILSDCIAHVLCTYFSILIVGVGKEEMTVNWSMEFSN